MFLNQNFKIKSLPGVAAHMRIIKMRQLLLRTIWSNLIKLKQKKFSKKIKMRRLLTKVLGLDVCKQLYNFGVIRTAWLAIKFAFCPYAAVNFISINECDFNSYKSRFKIELLANLILRFRKHCVQIISVKCWALIKKMGTNICVL